MVVCWPPWSITRIWYSVGSTGGSAGPPFFWMWSVGFEAAAFLLSGGGGVWNWTDGFVQAGGMDPPHRLRAVVLGVDDPGLLRARQVGADGQGAAAGIVDFVGAQDVKGVLVAAVQKGSDLFQLKTGSHSHASKLPSSGHLILLFRPGPV